MTAKAVDSSPIGTPTAESASTPGSWRRYRTLDQLYRAKDQIEVALDPSPGSLQLQARPRALRHHQHLLRGRARRIRKHGYSGDGKPHNVQVVVGVVMVAGWPIAHHVWEGNRLDHTTVQEVVADLRKRFDFGRLIFVGDRGMITEENLESLTRDGHGYIVGVKRRRNHQSKDGWPRLTTESGPLVRSASTPGKRPTPRAPGPKKYLRAIRGCV